MKLYEQVLEALKGMKASDLRALSDATGLPMPTIRNIKYGITGNPGVKKVQAIADFLHSSNRTPNADRPQSSDLTN